MQTIRKFLRPSRARSTGRAMARVAKAVMSEKIEQFKRLVAAHDLTYSYSDDGAVFRRGHHERNAIKALAMELPWDEAVKIWNEAVDKKIAAGYRHQFYWDAAKRGM